jgi:hypothetical protein
MLTSRLPLARPLAVFAWLGIVAVTGIWGIWGIGGCQSPDTFLRKDGGGPTGLGGSGVGGSPGLGGSLGIGGHLGIGGTGLGGAPGTGGRGTGGSVGTGGRATGGGGRVDAGSADVAGTGGRTGAGGATVVDAGIDGDGGDGSVIGGIGPCAGLCANPTVITTSTFPSTNLGVGATCFESTQTYHGGSCGNFVAPRTFSVNGAVIAVCSASGGQFTLAARVNGGYCFQASPGQFAYAYFGLF